MITFDPSEPTQVEATINTANASFTVVLEQPTLEEIYLDDAMVLDARVLRADKYADLAKNRLVRRLDRVIGWKDINDSKGTPVPFSSLSLKRLLVSMPEVAASVNREIEKLYAGTSLTKPAVSENSGTSATEQA